MRRFLTALTWGSLFFVLGFSPTLSITGVKGAYLIQVCIITGFSSWVLRCVLFEHFLAWQQSWINVLLFGFLCFAAFQIILFVLGLFPGPPLYIRASLDALITGSIYLMLFWWVTNLIEHEKDISRIMRVVFTVAALLAFIGIMQVFTGADKVLWTYGIDTRAGRFTGFYSTFSNENHFAAFIGMIVFMILGRFLYLNERFSKRKHRKRQEERLFILFALALASASLFMSLSRGGAIFFMVAMTVFYFFFLKHDKGGNSRLAFWIFVISVIAMLLWVGLEPVLKELATLEEGTADKGFALRFAASWAGVTQLVRVYPFLGTGLGSFPYVFSAVQPVDLHSVWNYLANDWIELLIEVGIVGFSLVALAVLIFIRRMANMVRENKSAYIRYQGAGCAGGFVSLILACLFTSPLLTTACAVYFFVLLAISMKLIAFHLERRHIPRILHIRMDALWKRVVALGLVGSVCAVLLVSLTLPVLAYETVRRGGETSIPHLYQAIKFDPLNADYYYRLGVARTSQGALWKDGNAINRVHIDGAIQMIRKAAALNPHHYKYYYGLAVIYARMHDIKAAEENYQEALKRAPRNYKLQIEYAIFCFNQAVVDSVAQDVKVTTLDFFDKGVEAYFKAKEVMPDISLHKQRNRVAGYQALNRIFHKRRLLPATTLL